MVCRMSNGVPNVEWCAENAQLVCLVCLSLSYPQRNLRALEPSEVGAQRRDISQLLKQGIQAVEAVTRGLLRTTVIMLIVSHL
jgi:hypothetical protein